MELASLLTGAGLTLAAHATLQLYVVPRVEARKRREDRWERDVRALGELLTGELAASASGARHATWFHHLVSQEWDPTQYDPAKVEAARTDARHAARAAERAFGDAARSRLPWLLDLIVALQPSATSLVELDRVGWRYRIATHRVFRFEIDDDWSEEEFDAAWKAESDARSALTAAVQALAKLSHPPRPSRRRTARQAARRLRTRLPGLRRSQPPSPPKDAGPAATEASAL